MSDRLASDEDNWATRIRIRDETKQRVRQEAQRERRSVSAMLGMLIERALVDLTQGSSA
jgi:predicted transcriptional regulator